VVLDGRRRCALYRLNRGRDALGPPGLEQGVDSVKILVCEKTGQWATVLRRVLGRWQDCLCETRSLAECWQQLGQHPASAVVWELTPANAQLLVERLAQLTRQFRRARALVVAAPELGPYELVVREAGAMHVAFSPWQLAAGSRMIERHLRQIPQDPTAVREMIWNRLPWSEPRS
jgi:hypothetical protein